MDQTDHRLRRDSSDTLRAHYILYMVFTGCTEYLQYRFYTIDIISVCTQRETDLNI